MASHQRLAPGGTAARTPTPALQQRNTLQVTSKVEQAFGWSAPEKEPCKAEGVGVARWLPPHGYPLTSPAGCCVAGGLEFRVRPKSRPLVRGHCVLWA